MIHVATVPTPHIALLARCLYQRVYKNWTLRGSSWEVRYEGDVRLYCLELDYRKVYGAGLEALYAKASATDRIQLIRLGLLPTDKLESDGEQCA